MNYDRYTVAVAFVGVAGLAVLTGASSVFAGCVIAGCGLLAFLLCLEI